MTTTSATTGDEGIGTWMDSRPSVSVVVPVYNSSGILPELVARLDCVLNLQTKEYELLLVNDGSQDESWRVIEELSRENTWIRGIDLMRNYGQHSALLAGIRAAACDVIVTMDDDLQHPPEEIPTLLAELDEGFDVVYGMPRQDNHAVWRNACSRAAKRMIFRASGNRMAVHTSAFRAFDARIRTAFEEFRAQSGSIDVLLSWGASRYSSVEVHHAQRAQGESQYTLRKLLVHALNMITGFSVWPLRFAAVLGGILALFGVGILAYVLVRYFGERQAVQGFTFLASIIAIFGGAQMMALGLIGEYLARFYSASIGYPPYVIRQDTSQDEKGEAEP